MITSSCYLLEINLKRHKFIFPPEDPAGIIAVTNNQMISSNTCHSVSELWHFHCVDSEQQSQLTWCSLLLNDHSSWGAQAVSPRKGSAEPKPSSRCVPAQQELLAALPRPQAGAALQAWKACGLKMGDVGGVMHLFWTEVEEYVV